MMKLIQQSQLVLKKGSDLKEKINEVLADISEEERQQIMEEAIKNQPSATISVGERLS